MRIQPLHRWSFKHNHKTTATYGRRRYRRNRREPPSAAIVAA